MTKLNLKPKDFLVILTGAGISAESGIKTFRDSDGLWENHSVEEVATPEGFANNPILVWKFYKERYYQALSVSPNPGHIALVDLEKKLNKNFLLVTQNVDGLHDRAGSKSVIEMHGSLNTCFCTNCKKKELMSDVDLNPDIPICSACGKMLRPDIVWFGEMPYRMNEIYKALDKATVFMTIGTSGNVYPAANFIAYVRNRGARTIGVNLEKPENMAYIDEFFQGKAGDILPSIL
ncbi:MAG: NAD-dependent deacylase [Candidatus Cloacimonetes bacterium]|nr:NAD-dependent deacylase [Candidatus Cloacimonadota bacterium]